MPQYQRSSQEVDEDLLISGTRIKLHSLRRDVELEGRTGVIIKGGLDDDGDPLYVIQLDGERALRHVPERFVSRIRQGQQGPQMPPPSQRQQQQKTATGGLKVITSIEHLENCIANATVVMIGIFASWCAPRVKFHPVFEEAARGAPEITMATVNMRVQLSPGCTLL